MLATGNSKIYLQINIFEYTHTHTGILQITWVYYYMHRLCLMNSLNQS